MKAYVLKNNQYNNYTIICPYCGKHLNVNIHGDIHDKFNLDDQTKFCGIAVDGKDGCQAEINGLYFETPLEKLSKRYV